MTGPNITPIDPPAPPVYVHERHELGELALILASISLKDAADKLQVTLAQSTMDMGDAVNTKASSDEADLKTLQQQIDAFDTNPANANSTTFGSTMLAMHTEYNDLKKNQQSDLDLKRAALTKESSSIQEISASLTAGSKNIQSVLDTASNSLKLMFSLGI